MLENLISKNPKVSRGERTVQLASITKIVHPNSALDRGFQFLQVLEVTRLPLIFRDICCIPPVFQKLDSSLLNAIINPVVATVPIL